jgi:hypothetical protein
LLVLVLVVAAPVHAGRVEVITDIDGIVAVEVGGRANRERLTQTLAHVDRRARPSARSARRVVCGPARAKTVAQGERARVFLVRRGEDDDEPYGCVRGSRKRRSLGSTYCYGSSSGCSPFADAAVAGDLVAYGTQYCCGGAGDVYFEVVVQNLRTGRVRSRQFVGNPGTQDARLLDLVVRPTGAAAWLWTRITAGPPRTDVVLSRSARCGEPQILAEGQDVDPGFLARRGSRVAFRQAGELRSAALC